MIDQIQPPLNPLKPPLNAVYPHGLIGEIAVQQRDLSLKRTDAAGQIKLARRQMIELHMDPAELLSQEVEDVLGLAVAHDALWFRLSPYNAALLNCQRPDRRGALTNGKATRKS